MHSRICPRANSSSWCCWSRTRRTRTARSAASSTSRSAASVRRANAHSTSSARRPRFRPTFGRTASPRGWEVFAMAQPNWNDDSELIRDLAAATAPDPQEQPDPVEQQVIAAAAAVLRWRTSDPDLELAALLYDSDLDRSALVRGSFRSSPRTLVFGCRCHQVEIELGDAGIEGQLIPP